MCMYMCIYVCICMYVFLVVETEKDQVSSSAERLCTESNTKNILTFRTKRQCLVWGSNTRLQVHM